MNTTCPSRVPIVAVVVVVVVVVAAVVHSLRNLKEISFFSVSFVPAWKSVTPFDTALELPKASEDDDAQVRQINE